MTVTYSPVRWFNSHEVYGPGGSVMHWTCQRCKATGRASSESGVLAAYRDGHDTCEETPSE